MAVAVLLIGSALAAGFLFLRLSQLGDALQQVVVPGSAELTLEDPGTYTVFHEHRSVVDGRVYAGPEQLPGLGVRVVSAETGQELSVRAPGMAATYDLDGRSGTAVLAFDVDRPGRYRVEADVAGAQDGRPYVLAVGRAFGTQLVLTIVGTVGLALAASAAAVAIAGVTFWRRRRAAAETPRPG